MDTGRIIENTDSLVADIIICPRHFILLDFFGPEEVVRSLPRLQTIVFCVLGFSLK